MKLRIDQKQLAEAARRAHRRLPNNPLNPVLAGLLIEAAPDQVTLSGFDLETSTRASLEAETLEPGHSLVSGRLLADVTAALPAGPIDVVADERELTVSAPGTTFALPAMNRGDYPALPVPPGTAGVAAGEHLAVAVGHAATVAMTPKEAVGSREAFGGVHISADGDQLVVEGSDGYRIARHRLAWTPDGDAAGDLLIPAADIAVTVKQMTGCLVHVGFPGPDGGVASLATDTLTVTSRTIATPYKNIDSHFPDPAKAAGWTRVDAGELLEAVKRAALVNEKEEQPITLFFDGDQVMVRGGVEGSRGSSRVDVEAADLDGFEIAFRAGFLGSLLAPISDVVQIWFTTPTKPALIVPVDDDSYRAVCMPVRLPK
ncbi:DNA polymerase III subunit beta [Streptomyces sp. NPDC006872]|uniref:DNA polymerase III subunit beta n=1 Tax=Streptomyces sp. NPDC006872 TaxID=3155720 RepID=UPI0033EB4D70